MVALLGMILLVVLLGPVLSKSVERNIEVFFLAAGVLAAMASGQLSWPLLHAALKEPLALTAAVLVFGAIARLLRPVLDRGVEKLLGVMPAHWIRHRLRRSWLVPLRARKSRIRAGLRRA